MTARRPATIERPVAPAELVLASAGTGKTFTLTSRLIGLLALGIPPDGILASTFTRKAAGEILGRTLSRLAEAALDESKAAELERHVGFGGPPRQEGLGRDRFLSILGRLLRDLHRLNVGTLDSFFGRLARTFPMELGLPAEWAIADDPTARRLDSEALQVVLEGSDPGAAVELIRMIMRGEAGRGVHDRLLDQLAGLREIRHLVHAAAAEAWHPFPDLELSRSASPDRREEVAEALDNAPLPLAGRGKPDRNYEKAVARAAADLRAGNWIDLCKRGLAAKLLAGEEIYSGKPIPHGLREAVQAALALARSEVGKGVNRQARALERLARLFDASLSHLQARQGAYRFQDIAFLLGGDDPLGKRRDFWYRLDRRTRHLLLDEFQDTALIQWEAMAPLAEEIHNTLPDGGSIVIVADPKQSVYGWRGAEPDLVHREGDRLGLKPIRLRESYRSSQVVLDFVNQVFADLPENPIWEGEAQGAEVAREWHEDFPPHRAARALEGYVGVYVGPRDERMTRTDRPALMAWAAGRIRDLVERHGKGSVGVLVRTNQAVARMTLELRLLGVDASEEGATSLTDSAAVSTVLALLKWADHPGDTFSHYQVAHSPLGEILRMRDPEDPSQGPALSARVRALLLTHGYGPTLARWIQGLERARSLDDRDRRRLLQLMELGHRWDLRATLRPEDFARFVHSQGIEAPSDADVRVMTVHQAKGLEFDVVALPELDTPLTRGRGRYPGLLPLRDPATGRIVKILPRIPKSVRLLFPEACVAEDQDRRGELRDGLGLLYVALTRARHALHLYVAEDDGPPPPLSKVAFSALVRCSLGLQGTPFRSGDTVWEHGNPRWTRAAGASAGEAGPEVSKPAVSGAGEGLAAGEGPRVPGVLLAGSGRAGRLRSLSHRTPSGWRSRRKVDLGRTLLLGPATPRHAGSLIHAWLQGMEWYDDWSPSRSDLRAVAAREEPALSPAQVEELMDALKRWLQADEISSRLVRGAYPPGARVEREAPFAVRIGDTILQGRMDRAVTVRERNRVTRAHVLDFKTDAVGAHDLEELDRLVSHYAEQMEAYREALCHIHRLPAERVTTTLLFLAAGRAVDLGP